MSWIRTDKEVELKVENKLSLYAFLLQGDSGIKK